MVETPTQVPTTLFAGDSFAWERELADYPADTWTLTYYFSNDRENFQVVATADGTKHVASVDGANTTYKPGRYRWHARVTDGSTTRTIDDGWLEVRPNPTGAKVDWRSHARKMIEAIEATLEGQASKQQLDLVSYSIGGTVNVNRDRDLLHKLRDKYGRELQGEDGGTAKDPRHLYVRFGAP